MLIKRLSGSSRGSRGRGAPVVATQASAVLDRRSFLARSGLAAGGLAGLSALGFTSMRKAQAAAGFDAKAPVKLVKNICTHCSVGCTVTAEVQNGV